MKTLIITVLIICFSLTTVAAARSDKRMQKMVEKLQLNEQQTTQIDIILESKKIQREEIHQQMKALREQTNGEIASILNEDQMEKFNKLQQKNKERKKERKKE
jgi:hypothetical protein